ncbi:MAG: MMPL family transporter [Pseudomonadota bacterium]|nr:MMPL family transporter [Pseudomonadota bacterium]
MTDRRAWIIALWAVLVAASIGIVAKARYITDLSAFLPAKPTPSQQLLVDQLRDGPASRLVMIAIAGGDPIARADLSRALAQRLRAAGNFSAVENGEAVAAQRDQEFIFGHRYLLSPAIEAERFTVRGLQASFDDSVAELAYSAGSLLKPLLQRDPTGEMLRITERLAQRRSPPVENGVWVSADGQRSLLFAQTRASGSDTDAQERAFEAVRANFRAIATTMRPASAIRLQMSGPGLFAVEARATIKRAATRLSIISSILVVGILLVVYRSASALMLGLLPVATGALAGIAAVALGFGAVHGVTLGFGITLIGESVDYSIYFFIQTSRGDAQRTWTRSVWPTVRLGMLTSVCGFASLVPSGFPGLSQLGVYSIVGLVAAAGVTRFVLPEMLPGKFAVHDARPFGMRLERLLAAAAPRRAAIATAAVVMALCAAGILYANRSTLWNRELSALSPLSAPALRADAALRADLGAADVLDLVVVHGPTLEAVLRGAERAEAPLTRLMDEHAIGGFDSPAVYLPSLATQRHRRNALPDASTLRRHLHDAGADLPLKESALSPFVEDVEAARHGPMLTPGDLQGTSLAAGFNALILHQTDHWTALMPLRSARSGAPIDTAHAAASLAAAQLDDTQMVDMKAETDALYADYLSEAIRLSIAGFGAIVLLLLASLRSPLRTARVLGPLGLAVLTVAAALVLLGRQLTIMHLVGMLLIVAVGSNYALFFDDSHHRRASGDTALTLASLAIANLSAVVGFGLLSFSDVPVLDALGETVAPGAFLALLYSSLLIGSERVIHA